MEEWRNIFWESLGIYDATCLKIGIEVQTLDVTYGNDRNIQGMQLKPSGIFHRK